MLLTLFDEPLASLFHEFIRIADVVIRHHIMTVFLHHERRPAIMHIRSRIALHRDDLLTVLMMRCLDAAGTPSKWNIYWSWHKC